MSREIIVDKAKAIKVIKNAGQWLKDSGREVSFWWEPSNLDSDFFSKFAKDNEFYVVLENGKPVGAAIIQEAQNLQDWSSVDVESYTPAIYLHYLAVERDWAKKGISDSLLDVAKEIAKAEDVNLVRLDTNADEPKLRGVYEDYGFKPVKELDEGDHRTILYELKV